MLLQNQVEMRKEIDFTLKTLQQKNNKKTLSKAVTHGCYASLTVTISFLVYNDFQNIWVFLLMIAITAVTLILSIHFLQRSTKDHQELNKHLDYFMTDPRNREYYSSLPDVRTYGTGYTPKAGTRLPANDSDHSE